MCKISPDHSAVVAAFREAAGALPPSDGDGTKDRTVCPFFLFSTLIALIGDHGCMGLAGKRPDDWFVLTCGLSGVKNENACHRHRLPVLAFPENALKRH